MKILCFLFLFCLAQVSAQNNCGRNRRRPWRSLTCQEQRQFLQACQDLKASGRWDELVLNHQRSGDWGHQVPAFLPWHRWLIWIAEVELQRVSGTCLTIPYWDWERQGGIESALRPDGFGTNTGRGCVRDGIAANWQVVETGGCLQRAFDDRWRISRDVEILSRITNSETFARFRVELEGAPHTNTHEWVGGAMADRWAVDDPIFLIHHCNVDRIWALWQNYWGHPNDGINQLGGNHYDANLNNELVFRYTRQINWNSPRTGRPPTIRELMMISGENAIMNYGYEQDAMAQQLLQTSNRFAQSITTSWNNPGRVANANTCQGSIFGGNPFGGNNNNPNQGPPPQQQQQQQQGGRPPQQQQQQRPNQPGQPQQPCSMGFCGNRPQDQQQQQQQQQQGGQQQQGVCRELYQRCNRNRHCCNQRCRRANDGRGRCLPERTRTIFRGNGPNNNRNLEQKQQVLLRGGVSSPHEYDRDLQEEYYEEEEGKWQVEGEDSDGDSDTEAEEEEDYLHQVPDFGEQQDRWYELLGLYSPSFPGLVFETLAREYCDSQERQKGYPTSPATPKWLAAHGIPLNNNITNTYRCHSIDNNDNTFIASQQQELLKVQQEQEQQP